MTSISIVVPTYNESDYIRTLLESIKSQNFEDYEIIICDGGSNDGTLEILEEYDVEVFSDKGDGPGAARNEGAEHASGDTILFLDADVKLVDDKVLSRVEASISREDVVAGTSSWIPFDGSIRGRLLLGLGSKMLKFMNFTGLGRVAVGNFLFIERKVFEEVDGFDASLPFNEDHELMKKASMHGKIVTLKDQFYVSVRRVDEKGVIGTLNDYVPPSIYYFFGKKDAMKDKYSFETVG
ncbi:glycosyltransferase [Candidatus Nanosalina sp. VS9-1]|uniref:glycosyltransferase n=1 Tax=Candidatus Nanosalina sp. VS9-1 TaxID=3388566 RepID=UPI0039DF9285